MNQHESVFAVLFCVSMAAVVLISGAVVSQDPSEPTANEAQLEAQDQEPEEYWDDRPAAGIAKVCVEGVVYWRSRIRSGGYTVLWDAKTGEIVRCQPKQQ